MGLVAILEIGGKCSTIHKTRIPKTSHNEFRIIDIATIKDRAKQKLVLMTLEPE